MFYEQFEALCAKKGVRPGRACVEMGLSRSLSAKWKATGAERPSTEALEKMSAYFNLPMEQLLGKESAPAGADAQEVTDDAIKFALFGGDGEITDEMYNEVKSFAAFVKEKYKRK